ncbi:cytochrome c1 [Suttonella sp. R2A3]|uniref:cytochrome c1 n=1 Tax=Suttonella sp. R2A3 TaxID=2908648 RepID=UPI001F15F500|nr:cytochrome c1 [Suttonella sp. R2A3]UJF24566.1 cytochrome c1 [Suttonella sp. R2A3]
MNMKRSLIILAAVFSIGAASASGGSATYPNEHFNPDVSNQESLQRGAKYFVNYCAACHSVQYQRYNRLFEDAGIPEEVGEENLIFTGAKVPEQMHNAMTAESGEKWFGKAPPDLSLTARAKGSNFIYNYLNAFYVDDSRPLGFNNSVFPGASMPNPLWQLQGLQKPVYESEKHCEQVDGEEVCEETHTLVDFESVSEGELSSEQYKQVTADLTNFLAYVSDPSALDRMRIGPWVLIFIVFLTIIFYILKKEYWRDIH